MFLTREKCSQLLYSSDCRQCTSVALMGHVCYATPHLDLKITEAESWKHNLRESGQRGRTHPLSQSQWVNTWAGVKFKLFLLEGQYWSPFAQALQQLFESEMCRRETKNRTPAPLSQLPLHCLWDYLCVSPLSSFSPLCLPLAEWLLLPLPLCFPTFLKPWIRSCVSGQSYAGMKGQKQDTTSFYYSPLSR